MEIALDWLFIVRYIACYCSNSSCLCGAFNVIVNTRRPILNYSMTWGKTIKYCTMCRLKKKTGKSKVNDKLYIWETMKYCTMHRWKQESERQSYLWETISTAEWNALNRLINCNQYTTFRTHPYLYLCPLTESVLTALVACWLKPRLLV